MYYRAKLTQEDEHWLVEFPDCPGCQTFGESKEHALAQAKEALEGWLEATLQLRRLPPSPRAAEGEPVFVDSKLSVAVQFRIARGQLGLSQAELAGKAGVSQQQIARLESPDNNPNLESVSSVADALGLTVTLGPKLALPSPFHVFRDESGNDATASVRHQHR